MIEQFYYFYSQSCTNAYGIILPCRDSGSGAVGSAIRVAIAIAAGVSILFVTIGGFRYIISNGDPANISKAKNTIIYSLIGLVVSVTAYGIVAFVIDRAG